MEENKKRGLHGIISALVVFAIVIAAFIFVFAPLQYRYGMWGLAATECGILAIALSAALILRVKPSEMFPVKKMRARQVFGVIVMWLGSMSLMMIINIAFFFFFPEAMEVGGEMSEFFETWRVLPMLFVVAVMPAICEETLHRGFMLSGFRRRIHNKWVLCIIMGILFGIFHMDPYRFIGTGFLGGVMTYILLETDNFLLNMLFHFFNNFIIELMSLSLIDSSAVNNAAVDAEAVLTRDILPASFALYCILGCMCPIIILSGTFLLKGAGKLREEGRFRFWASIIFAAIFSLILLVTGVTLFNYILSDGLINMEGLI